MNIGQAFTPEQPLDDAAVQVLEASLSGQVLRPGESEFLEAKTIYNAMIAKDPILITRCHSMADVVHVVNFARDRGIPLSVRGGGHNVAGKALADGGLVIDLSQMNGVRVDPETRTARVQGGATWRDVDAATHEHGLATPGGTVSPTGVGGLTLGGGVGWLMRAYGLSCDNLRQVRVVTANGEQVVASDSENADLFWALRGGGGAGTFGVVTEFSFQLYPLHTVLGGLILHPYERAREAIEFFREFSESAPEQLTVITTLMTMPEGMKAVAFGVGFIGPPEEGEEVISPLLDWGPPLSAEVGPMPYPQLQQMLDDAFPNGLQNYWRAGFLKSLDDTVIRAMLDHFDEVTSPLTMLLLEQYGGAVGRVPPDATAFPHRDATYNLGIFTRWTDPGEAEHHIAWTRSLHDAVQPSSTGGAYVNYLSDEAGGRIRTAYGPETYERLVQVRAKYDPDRVFQTNRAIQ